MITETLGQDVSVLDAVGWCSPSDELVAIYNMEVVCT